METTRQQKINRLIQKELGEVFLLQTKGMPGILVSVSAVRISPDLSVAKAYLSIFPSNKGAELLENIKANVKAIRFDIGQRLGKQLRIIPELVFYLDDSLDYLENIDRLLNTDNKQEDKE
ncbi:30S ribosome-binding factor RbfA [Dysgonomonas macrotermitis]|uniref:Ribosome-binding factor A n=1 Tax=Dysgonomonas macrotermitis TaxID=1346286 RepID=A0A1M4TUR8_9BACT|nr:30S ribosome-binding factor RbfA [Dysgonomonas macrotermitis]SHE48229.1 ribosome-binding factor A [Dysgonomonas macrotermitis]